MVLWLLTMYTLEVLMNQVNPNRSVRKEGGLEEALCLSLCYKMLMA